MSRVKKVISGLALSLMCVTAFAAQIFAAGSVSVSGDKETAAVGDTYTVSVKIEGTDGAAVAPDVSVNYDVNRLEFVSCSGEYGGGGGGYITLSGSGADITFNILSGGQADVDVTGIFDGDGANAQVVTATIMVEGEDTAAVDDRARDMGTGVEAGSIATLDGKVVQAVFADEFMPAGFSKTTVTYEEQMVEAAQFNMGGVVLLYVTDADGNNGNFDIYDQATGELSDFLQISGIENRFIIALKASEDVKVPDDFTKATLQWNAQTLEAYAYTGTQPDGASVPVSDFFLLYAVSSEGNTGWYMYDQNEGTYQRYVEGLHGGAGSSSDSGLLSQITGGSSSDSEEGGINVMLIILIAMAVVLVGLLITVIIMAVKLHEFNSYDYIDEDEEYEDEEVSSTEGFLNAAQNELGRPPVQVQIKDKEPVKEKIEPNTNRPSDELPDEMPKSKNIYEQFREEDEARENTNNQAADSQNQPNIPEEFVVRNKAGRNADVQSNFGEDNYEDNYEDDEDYEDDGFFSPRARGEKLSRAEKKALKAEEKARKKAEKRMKKEFGEYGPVDWESWQNGMEGGARTAAAHMSQTQQMDIEDIEAAQQVVPNRTPRMQQPEPSRAPQMQHQSRPRQEMQQQPARESQIPPQPRMQQSAPSRAPQMQQEMPAPQPRRERQPQIDEYDGRGVGAPTPMDMVRNIPANDNKAPVQPKPVQQFDFDDDFEFEFLDLDED